MFNLHNKYQNLKRSKEIFTVLVKFGFGFLFNKQAAKSDLGIDVEKTKFRGETESIRRMSGPAKLRTALEELGPTFVKLGQILSTRPDLLPRAYTDELSNLQDAATPFSAEEAEVQFKNEFNQGTAELFAEFEPEPMAAASLSQVHRARLRTGELVAVKVQRPDIRNQIETDISILHRLAAIMEKRMHWSRIYQPADLVREFSYMIRQELDFKREAHNLESFHRNFPDSEEIRMPKVYWKQTSERIITMELVEGTKINRVIKSEEDEFDKQEIASRITNAFLKQVFKDGFFHGDPHPGNIIIQKDNVVGFLDFGIVGRIDDWTKNKLADVLIAITQNDVEKIIKVWREMDLLDPLQNTQPIERELQHFLDKYYGIPSKDIKIGRLLEEIIDIMVRHEVKAPTVLALLTKALIHIEGICRQLDPDFNMVAYTEPYAKELLKRKYSPHELFKKSTQLSKDLLEVAEKIPYEFYLLSKGLRQGKLSVGFKHEHLEELTVVIDRASNRIAFGLIIAALIIGSSFIMSIDKGPFLFNYPILGLLGYMVAAFLGLGLVVSIIIRRGKL